MAMDINQSKLPYAGQVNCQDKMSPLFYNGTVKNGSVFPVCSEFFFSKKCIKLDTEIKGTVVFRILSN